MLKKIRNKILSFNLENVFAVIAGLFALVFIFIIPPGWNSDEYQHAYRVEQLFRGQLYATDQNGEKSEFVGGYINSDIINFMDSFTFWQDRSNLKVGLKNSKASPLNLYKEYKKHKWATSKTYVGFNGSSVYSPVSYIPQLIGRAIGAVFSDNYYIIFIVMRIFSAIFYITSVYLAIKYMNRGKWIIFCIGLMPAALIQSVAVSADASVWAAAMATIILVDKIMYTKRDSTKLWIALFVSLLVLGFSKSAYIAFTILPGLLIFKYIKSQESIKYKIKKASVVAFIIVASLLPSLLWIKSVSYIGTTGNNADKDSQITLLKNNPLKFPKALLNTYFNINVSEKPHFRIIFDTNKEPLWAQLDIGDGFLLASIVCLFISIGLNDSIDENKRKNDFYGFAVFVLGFIVINLALYLYYSPPGALVVYGVQGRYLLPFLVLALLPFINSYKNKSNLKIFIYISLLIVLIASVARVIKFVYY